MFVSARHFLNKTPKNDHTATNAGPCWPCRPRGPAGHVAFLARRDGLVGVISHRRDRRDRLLLPCAIRRVEDPRSEA